MQVTPAASFSPESEYLAYMRALATASAAAQKALYQEAEAGHRQQASAHTRLRLGLALSLLGTPYGDAARARRLLKEVLTSAHAMPADLESLVQAHIKDLNHRLELEHQLALLQQELDKAQAKIQALTTIERTIEQPVPETKTRQLP